MALREPNMPQFKEKPAQERPKASEFGQMVARLAARLKITGTELRDIIKQEHTRRENADALREWLRTRPKAKS